MQILSTEFTTWLRAQRERAWNGLKAYAQKLVATIATQTKRAWLRASTDVVQYPWRLLLAFTIAALFGAWFGVRAFALWSVFLLFAFYDWENRIVGVFALLSLVSCPVLLQLKRDEQAEVMAVYAYFFLAMTVGLQLIEYKRFPERFPEDEDESV